MIRIANNVGNNEGNNIVVKESNSNNNEIKIDKDKTKDKIKDNVEKKIEEKVKEKKIELEDPGKKKQKTFLEIIKEPEKVNLGQLGKYSYLQTFLFCVNLLVFPAMGFQMWKTFQRKESSDFSPYFILFQLLGGAPEGMVGAIIGNLLGNTQMLIIGLYAMFYNSFMLFFRLFGKNGLVLPLF
jgi:hypothetical protein